MSQSNTSKRKKIIAGVVIGILLAAIGLLVWLVGMPLIRFITDPERFRAWIDAHAFTGRLAYLGMVILQVVIAIIPGEPLEIAGGYAFGALEGTFLCMLGSFVGSMIVFLLVRRFGMKLVGIFFSQEKLQSVKFLKTSTKKDILFLLIFMIPGTPKDLLCYFAGLTDMKIGQWMLICSFGRIPSLVTSTIGGSALGDKSYLFAVIVFAVAIAISVAGLLIYNRICKKHAAAANAEEQPNQPIQSAQTIQPDQSVQPEQPVQADQANQSSESGGSAESSGSTESSGSAAQ